MIVKCGNCHRYKAIHPPRKACFACWLLYFQRHHDEAAAATAALLWMAETGVHKEAESTDD